MGMLEHLSRTCTHTHSRHMVSAYKLVSLLWADRVDKPFMRGINKAALPLPTLSASFQLKASNLLFKLMNLMPLCFECSLICETHPLDLSD